MSHRINSIKCEHCKSFRSSIFCDLNEDLLSDVNFKKSTFSFQKGKEIFIEGTHSNGIYCIMNGKVKVYKFGLEKDQIVRFATKTEIIGYRALISDEEYSASAEALEDTNVCFIPKDMFFDLINKDVSFSLKIMKILSKDLKWAELNSLRIAQRTVMERLAEYLIVKEKAARKNKETTSFSRKDLSDIIGCAPETLIRALSSLRKSQIIDIKKRKIIILNLELLFKIANSFD